MQCISVRVVGDSEPHRDIPLVGGVKEDLSPKLGVPSPFVLPATSLLAPGNYAPSHPNEPRHQESNP
jgi:hypothetical protein